MSKAWGGMGSWAAAAEAEDEQLAAAAIATANSDPQSFPSLREAVTAKPKNKKMSLAEFNTGAYAAVGSGDGRQRLTPSEMIQLPTGPMQRSPDESYAGNRGFSNYGGQSRERGADSDGQWGGGRRSYGGFDDDRRGRGSDHDLQPSRADETDDWGAKKRSMPPPAMDSGRSNRYESHGGDSRSGDLDNWTMGKKPVNVAPPARSGDSGRPRLVLNPPRGDDAMKEPSNAIANTNKANPFGAARPREEILAEKGLDWKKLDMETEEKKTVNSSPLSPHSSSPERLGLGSENASKPKVNPFGNAKPREVVLEEKGKDWRKMDLEFEHQAVERVETEEEKALKVEIENLKKELDNESPDSGAEQSNIHDLIQLKQKDLETLTKELDDKVGFSQKAVERPGSGVARSGSFVDDTHSANSAAGRPRSRGTGELWSRNGEDRRNSFHGGRDRGFVGNGESDRSGSRARW